MPMVGSGLATVVKSAIQSIPEGERDFDAVWNAIGDAIVTYIQTNAVVTGTATGVTAGAAAAPVVGTIA